MKKLLSIICVNPLFFLVGCMGDNVNSKDLNQNSIGNSYQWLEVNVLEADQVLKYKASLRQNGYYNTWINFSSDEYFSASVNSYSRRLSTIEPGVVSFYVASVYENFSMNDSFVDYNFQLNYKSQLFLNTIKSPYIYSIKEAKCSDNGKIICYIHTYSKYNQQTTGVTYRYVLHVFNNGQYKSIDYGLATHVEDYIDKVVFDNTHSLSLDNKYYLQLQIYKGSEFQLNNHSPHTFLIYEFQSKMIQVNN